MFVCVYVFHFITLRHFTSQTTPYSNLMTLIFSRTPVSLDSFNSSLISCSDSKNFTVRSSISSVSHGDSL